MPNQESPSAAVSGSLVRLEAILRQWEHAERHFRLAIALNEQIGARPAQLRPELGYAAMLLTRASRSTRPRRHACSTTRWQPPIVSG
jgi:hypothetical protein